MDTTTITTSPARHIAVHALAAVGFIVLIILGMALAIYAATFVPRAVSRIGSAAVYLSSVFVPAPTPVALQVVEPGTTVPFPDAPGAGIATTTSAVATTTKPVVAHPATTPGAGTPDYNVYPVGGTGTTPATLTGFSDLTVKIVETGYLTSADTASFVKSDMVPAGQRGAIKFTISNIGTNVSGTFDFKAPLPTSSTYTFTSDTQSSLLPGEHIDYVLGFDRTRSGDNREITITVDPENTIHESRENNNSDTATLTIK